MDIFLIGKIEISNHSINNLFKLEAFIKPILHY